MNVEPGATSPRSVGGRTGASGVMLEGASSGATLGFGGGAACCRGGRRNRRVAAPAAAPAGPAPRRVNSSGSGSTSVATSGTTISTASATACAASDNGRVRRDRVPIWAGGSVTAPNRSRGMSILPARSVLSIRYARSKDDSSDPIEVVSCIALTPGEAGGSLVRSSFVVRGSWLVVRAKDHRRRPSCSCNLAMSIGPAFRGEPSSAWFLQRTLSCPSRRFETYASGGSRWISRSRSIEPLRCLPGR